MMISALQSTADEIGMDCIRSVVDEFYDKVQRHPALSVPFSLVEDWVEHKDHLTYFWWVMLGGKRDRAVSFSVVMKHARAGFSGELLKDWKTLFAEVVRARVPEGPAEVWLGKVDQLGVALLMANDVYLARE